MSSWFQSCMNKKSITYFVRTVSVFVSAIFISGCSQQAAEPPKFQNAINKISVEACNSIDFNILHITPSAIRSLVGCLNGTNQAVQPYQDLLNAMDDKDLEAFLEPYNQFATAQRTSEFTSWVDLLRQKGLAKDIYKDIAVITESGAAQDFLTLLRRVYADANDPSKVDPNVSAAYDFVLDVLNQKLGTSTLEASANLLSNPRAKAVAYALSLDRATSYVNSNKSVEIIASIVKEWAEDHSIQRVLQQAFDPKVFVILKNIISSDEGAMQIAAFMKEVSVDAHNGNSQLSEIRDFVRMSEMSLSCFSRMGPGTDQINSIFDIIVKENQKLVKTPQKVEDFYLIQSPILLSSIQKECSLSNDLVSKVSHLIGLAEKGHAQALHRVLASFSMNERVELLKSVLKSDNLIKLAPITEELEQRKSLYATLNMFNKDVSFDTWNTLSKVTESYIKYSGPLETMVLKAINQDTDLVLMKAFARSAVRSMGDSRGGFGDLLASFAEGHGLHNTQVVQEFAKTFLSNKQLLAKWSPVFLRIINVSKLQDAIRFTGELASNGELDRLLGFLIQVSKSQLGNSGVSHIAGTGYQKSRDEDRGSLTDSVVTKKPVGDYSKCRSIAGDLFENNGQNLEQAILCLNARGDASIYARLVEELKKENLLSDFAAILGRVTLRSNHIQEMINQLAEIRNSGDLGRLSKSLYQALNEPYALVKKAEPLLAPICESSKFDRSLEGIGNLMKRPEFPDFYLSLEKMVRGKSDPIVRLQLNKFRDAYGIYPSLPDGGSDADNIAFWQKQMANYSSLLVRPAADTYSNDLEALLAGLKAYISERGPNALAEFLNYITAKTTKVRYWPGIENEPMEIELTPGEQAALLVIEADHGVTFIKHIGSYFQIQIANSKNLTTTLKELKVLVNLGVSYTRLVRDRRLRNHLLNLRENFAILEDLNQRGYLRLLQLLYRTTMQATPAENRYAQNPNVNHMDVVHIPLRLGVATYINSIVQQLASQGRLISVGTALTNWLNNLTSRDVSAATQLVMQLNKDGSAGPLAQLIQKYYLQSMPQTSHMLSTLTQAVIMAGEMSPRPTGVLESVSEGLRDKELSQKFINYIVAEMSDSYENNKIWQMTSNYMMLPIDMKRSLYIGFSLLAFTPKEKSAYLTDFVSVASILAAQPGSDAFIDALVSYLNQPSVITGNPGPSELGKILDQFRGRNGLLTTWADVLTDPVSRQQMIRIMKFLAAHRLMDPMLRDVMERLQNGDFDGIIDMGHDYLIKGPGSKPIKSKKIK